MQIKDIPPGGVFYDTRYSCYFARLPQAAAQPGCVLAIELGRGGPQWVLDEDAKAALFDLAASARLGTTLQNIDEHYGERMGVRVWRSLDGRCYAEGYRRDRAGSEYGEGATLAEALVSLGLALHQKAGNSD